MSQSHATLGQSVRNPVYAITETVNLDDQIRASGISSKQLNLMMLRPKRVVGASDFLAQAREVNTTELGRKTDVRFACQTQWTSGSTDSRSSRPPCRLSPVLRPAGFPSFSVS